MRRVRTAVLISGNGSNLQALIDAAKASDYPAELTLVLSNNADAFGLKRAEDANIPTIVIEHRNFETRTQFDAMIDAALESHGIELVCLAGFMRILSDGFVERWRGKLLNIHPSLLPKYKGLDTHARAIAAGDREHGATVHWVTPELDSGEIILQEALPIAPDDTADSLKERVHVLEHQLYPAALKGVAEAIRHNGPRYEAGTRQKLGHWPYALIRWWDSLFTKRA